jgi:hypothetical protein
LRLGRPRTAWTGDTAFPCSAFDTGEFRFALLHRQSRECAPGHVRRPGLDCVPFWLQPWAASCGWVRFHDAYEHLIV